MNNASFQEGSSTIKRKQLNRLNQSKKSSCPAYMYVREIVLFPDFSIRPEILSSSKHLLRNEKMVQISQLRKTFRPEILKTVNRFFVEIPLPEAHSGHPLRKMNASIKTKLDELIMFKHYEKRHIQLIIQDHIKEAMLKNTILSSQLDAYPNETEISDYIHLVTSCTPIIEVHMKEEFGSNKEANDDPQQASSHKGMERSLQELKVILHSCADEDTLQDVKLQVNRMIQKLRNSSNGTNSGTCLGKRHFPSLDKYQSHSEFSTHTVNSTVQQNDSNAYNHNNATLTIQQTNHGFQNQHLQYQAKHPQNAVAQQAMASMDTSTSENMLTSFSRFMESDQDILPSLVDQVITDSSIRTAPNDSFSYFHQFPNR